MQRKKPDVDVIMDVLKQTLEANPSSQFLQSLMHQYQERGGLSKKQLQGLHGKASRVPNIAASKLATLEAIILKKHEKQRSEAPKTVEVISKDVQVGEMIEAILDKYPQHKRVIFYKNKYDGNAVFSALEKTELEKFYKLLVK